MALKTSTRWRAGTGAGGAKLRRMQSAVRAGGSPVQVAGECGQPEVACLGPAQAGRGGRSARPQLPAGWDADHTFPAYPVRGTGQSTVGLDARRVEMQLQMLDNHRPPPMDVLAIRREWKAFEGPPILTVVRTCARARSPGSLRRTIHVDACTSTTTQTSATASNASS